jgi:hypothetical protein
MAKSGQILLSVSMAISIVLVGETPAVSSAEPSLADRAKSEIAAVRANQALIRELGGMGEMSLVIRDKFLKLRKDATPEERDQLLAVWNADYAQVDAENTREMWKLLSGRGWFRQSEVGDRTASLAFDVVQHSDDLKLQEGVLAKMEPLLTDHEVRGEDYALLYDRVALQEGRPQRYGTQGTHCENGKYAVPPDVEDPARLDQRRAQMGMEPMAGYLVELDEMYGKCAEPAK